MKKFSKNNKVRIIFFTTLLSLSACSQTPKIVTAKDGNNALQTRCPGIGTSWSGCYEKANKSCSSGFNVIEQEQHMIDLDLPVRILTFRCK